jgi:hypothetical protein
MKLQRIGEKNTTREVGEHQVTPLAILHQPILHQLILHQLIPHQPIPLQLILLQLIPLQAMPQAQITALQVIEQNIIELYFEINLIMFTVLIVCKDLIY